VALTDTEARPASQEVDLAVSSALGSLADVDRDVFLLREVAGLGYEEIASTCDLTPDAFAREFIVRGSRSELNCPRQ
jgi:DNA-directed RNA polymerase specialized sigma24 family protein